MESKNYLSGVFEMDILLREIEKIDPQEVKRFNENMSVIFYGSSGTLYKVGRSTSGGTLVVSINTKRTDPWENLKLREKVVPKPTDLYRLQTYCLMLTTSLPTVPAVMLSVILWIRADEPNFLSVANPMDDRLIHYQDFLDFGADR